MLCHMELAPTLVYTSRSKVVHSVMRDVQKCEFSLTGYVIIWKQLWQEAACWSQEDDW